MNDKNENLRAGTRRHSIESLKSDLLAGDDHPHDDVHEDARHAAWNERQQKGEPEPERADAEECCESAANAREHAVAF